MPLGAVSSPEFDQRRAARKNDLFKSAGNNKKNKTAQEVAQG